MRYTVSLSEPIMEECNKWADIIRSKDDYRDRYAELNLDYLRYGEVRDAIIFTALGPDDYRYDPDTPLELKDSPNAVDVARFNRTLDLLGDLESNDHISAILGYLHWAVGNRDEALEALEALEEPTRLAQLTATALAIGMPGDFHV